ncbi:hypothetical protein [Allofournierella massiliensis]|uniref:hypothetical protein n=1 Tax=Allofournierella massiliensis TaxID=1650663 RepID=UPI00097D26EF|nr:hypothetical protein [Fournierella massiliensis]
MSSYQIFTDATADLSSGMMARLPSVEMSPMNVEIGGLLLNFRFATAPFSFFGYKKRRSKATFAPAWCR